jgi:inorganic pyrophosphatase
VYLKTLLLNLDGGDDEEIVVTENHPEYQNLKKKTEESRKEARIAAHRNSTYKDVKKALDLMMEDEGGEDDTVEEDSTLKDLEALRREKQNKKRKMLKPFREYTVPQNEEGKFKGWSKRAARDMAATCKKIKEGKEEYLKFRKAYREIYASRRQHK